MRTVGEQTFVIKLARCSPRNETKQVRLGTFLLRLSTAALRHSRMAQINNCNKILRSLTTWQYYLFVSS